MSSAVSPPESELKTEAPENLAPSQFIEADPLAVNFNRENLLVRESELKVEVFENLDPPGWTADPLAVNSNQENSLIPASELKIEVPEKIVLSDLINADPLAVNLNEEKLANILSSTDLKIPTYCLVPVLKLELEPKNTFERIESDLISIQSSGCKDIVPHTDFITMREDSAETSVSVEMTASTSISSSFFGNSEALSIEDGNNQALISELIIGNCDAPIFPARESPGSPSTSARTANQLNRIKKAAPNVSTLIRAKQVKKSRHRFQVVNDKVGVGVRHHVKGKECFKKSRVKLQAHKETTMKESFNASEKRVTRFSTRLKEMRQAGDSLEDIWKVLNVNSECCSATASDVLETFPESMEDSSATLNSSSEPAVIGSNLGETALSLSIPPAASYSMQRTTFEKENSTDIVVIEDQDGPAANNRECLKTNSNISPQVNKNNGKEPRIVYTCLECSPHKKFCKKSILTEHMKKFHISKCILRKKQQKCPKVESGVSKDMEESNNSGTSVAKIPPLRIVVIQNNQNNQPKFLAELRQPGQHMKICPREERPSTEEKVNSQTSENNPPEIPSASGKNRKNKNNRKKSSKPKTALSHLESIAALANEHLKVFKVNLSSHLMSKKQVFLQDEIHLIPSRGWGCDLCGKFYSSRYSLKEHKKMRHYQLNEFLCQNCQKVFKSINQFQRHEIDCKTHLYKCSVCGKSFARLNLYERHHTRRHGTPVVYTCLECSPHKHFDYKPDLTLHIKTRHVDNYTYPCKTCGKPITNKKLAQHVLTHNIDALALTRSLENRLKTLSAIKNSALTCMFCRKYFDVKLELIEHLVEVHLCSVLELTNSDKPVFFSVAGTQGVQNHLQAIRNLNSDAIEKRLQNLSQKKLVSISTGRQESSIGGTSVTAKGFPMPVIQTSQNQKEFSKFISEENQTKQHTVSICGGEQSSVEKNVKCKTAETIVSEVSAVSANGFPMPVIKTSQFQKEFSKFISEGNQTKQHSVSICGEEQSSVKKSMICETVKTTVSEIPPVSANGFPMPIIKTSQNHKELSKFISEENQTKQHTVSTCGGEQPSVEKNMVCATAKTSVSETSRVAGNVVKRKLSELEKAASRAHTDLEVVKVTLSSHPLSKKQVTFHEEIHYIRGVGWGCDVCGIFYSSRRCLKEHKKRQHYQLNEFVCPTCHKVFRSVDMFKNHENNCSNHRYECPDCGKVYGSMIRYEEHYKLKHKPIVEYTCAECSPHKCFEKKSDLYFHIKVKHVNKYVFPCKACGKLITNIKMAKHLRTHDRKNIQCSHCGKHFTATKGLKEHLKIHNAIFPCQFCEKGFKLKPELVKHLKEHEDKRSFVCEHCGKAFFRSGHLFTHLKSHQEKEFICAKCNRGFVLKHQLTAHMGTIACGANSKTSSKRMKTLKNTGKKKRGQKIHR